MMNRRVRTAGALLALAMVVAPWGRVASAQTPSNTQSATERRTAEQTREDLRRVLRQFPPALGRVLVLDPTLLTNSGYLAAYPALQQFLASHPEIARDPTYYFRDYVESAYAYERAPADPALEMRRAAVNAWRGTFEAMAFLTGFILFLLALGWLIKYVVDHRRWLRATRTQSEVHGKLMERFTSSEELRAYMESPAGQKFLQASPLVLEPATTQRSVGAPFSRILWSVQVGIVLAALGIGFMVVRRGLEPEVQQLIGAWGTLAIALGVGFAISAGASYVISTKLGLLGEK